MTPEIITALIAAVVSIVGTSITLTIGLRNIRLEKERLLAERDRIELDKQRLYMEQSRVREQRQMWETESERVRAETRKLISEAAKAEHETQQIKRQRLERQRREISDVLKLFERAAFEAPFYSEEPVAMFLAVRQTRIALQQSGASYIIDRKAAQSFGRIRHILLNAENEVEAECPEFVQLVDRIGEHQEIGRIRREVKKALGGNYTKPVGILFRLRSEIAGDLRVAKARVDELDNVIKQS